MIASLARLLPVARTARPHSGATPRLEDASQMRINWRKVPIPETIECNFILLRIPETIVI
jgi:hypothetical protein